jgi:hypothetical protein
MDELDRILSEEHLVAPPPGFSRRVMATITAETSTPGPIPFPWHYVRVMLAAVVAAAIICFACAAWLRSPGLLSMQAARDALAPGSLNSIALSSTVLFAGIALLRYSWRRLTY